MGLKRPLIDTTDRQPAGEPSRESVRARGERVKELNCLYKTSMLTAKIERSQDEVFQAVVELIPSAWQYPEITCARIAIEGQQYRTDIFNETAWKQVAEIGVLGREVGTVEVYYLQERPAADEGPFLEEERDLIDALAREMGRFVELKLVDKAHRESERRYRELFCSIMEGIVLLDKSENILFCNPAYAKIFQEESENYLTGKSFLDSIPASEHKFVSSQFVKLRNGESPQFELKITTAKGNDRTIMVSASPRFDDEPDYIGIFAAIMDITELKELQRFNSRAQRLETAGRIAGQVAHDFNNLLAPLTAYPELIKSELPADHSVLRYVDAMQKSAAQMADINQQLLTLGRRARYTVEVLNLGEIINDVIGGIEPTPKTLVIDVDISPDLMAFKGGASQIYRAILNLVNNARDTMKDKGYLKIRAENYYLEKLIGKPEQIPTGEYVKLAVSDTGPGIPAEIINKIFDPFFSTKTVDKGRGSGLGLSVVHAVVEDHNGYIDVESTVDRGTSFFIYFPIARENLKMSADDHIVGGTEKILIVDDDGIQRDVALAILKELGYDAASVESGEEAIDHIRKYPPDLLIIDMIMPDGIDGFETYKRALEINPGQRAIIISGYSRASKVEEAKKLGIGDFVTKPLTVKSLAIALRKVLDKEVVCKSDE